MWLLTILIGCSFMEGFHNQPCVYTPLPSNNTQVMCTHATPGPLPNNTECLTIEYGFWTEWQIYVLNLTSLRFLKLLDMKGKGLGHALLDDSFANLTSLEKLKISGFNWRFMKIEENAFRGLINLRNLELSRCLGITKLPGNLFNGLHKLESLCLSYGYLRELDDNAFMGLSNLRSLFMKHNQFTLFQPKMFDLLKNLRYLDITTDESHYNDMFQLYEADTFRALKNLTELRLNLKSKGTVPAALFNGLSNLETLYLETSAYKRTKYTVPYTILAGLHNLKHLNLEAYGEKHLPDLTGLVNIQSIKLPIYPHNLQCSCHLLTVLNNVNFNFTNKENLQCVFFFTENGVEHKLIREVTCSGLPVPPFYDGRLPDIFGVKNDSFTIKLIQFDEVDGKIRNYDVILLKHDAGGYEPRPHSYTDDDIASGKYGLFVAGRITNRTEFGKEVEVGKAPLTAALTTGTKYSVFVRGYITDTLYQSTEWYRLNGEPWVTTLGKKPTLKTSVTTLGVKPSLKTTAKPIKYSNGFATWKIVVIVVVIVAAVAIGGSVYWNIHKWKNIVVKNNKANEAL